MPKVTRSFNVRSDRRLLDVEAAYIAGFMDGEGTLTIQASRRPEARAGYRHDPRMSVSNTRLESLEFIRGLCGGRIVSDIRKGHQKPCYVLQWSPNQIRYLLPQIASFMKIKCEQARVLADLLALKKSGQKLTDAEWQEAERLRIEIKRLNWRGSGEPPEFETLSIRQSRLGNNQWKKTL